jgi:hypothetical protein
LSMAADISSAPGGGGARYVGVGCLMAVAGLFSGGMIAVLAAKFVGLARGCTPPEGLPACDWHVYWLVGMVLGATTLPWLVIRRLRQSSAAPRNSERG